VDHVILIDVTVAVLVVAVIAIIVAGILVEVHPLPTFWTCAFYKENDWSRNNVVARVE
jgi:hypothetical protein